MVKTKEQILKEKKISKRTFKEDTSLARIEDRITELETRIEELENK